jgi:hypothetical protein
VWERGEVTSFNSDRTSGQQRGGTTILSIKTFEASSAENTVNGNNCASSWMADVFFVSTAFVRLIHLLQDTYTVERDDGEVEEGVGLANIVTM